MDKIQAQAQALKNLKENPSYAIITEALKDVIETIDNQILDEGIPIGKKETMIIRRNLIRLFIDLPDDLIQQFEVEMSNTATAPNLG